MLATGSCFEGDMVNQADLHGVIHFERKTDGFAAIVSVGIECKAQVEKEPETVLEIVFHDKAEIQGRHEIGVGHPNFGMLRLGEIEG